MLFGRNWLHYVRLDWKALNPATGTVHQSTTHSLESIQKRYAQTVFSDGLGCISKFKAKLNIQPDFQPKFRRPRSVPFATEDAVGLELNRQ